MLPDLWLLPTISLTATLLMLIAPIAPDVVVFISDAVKGSHFENYNSATEAINSRAFGWVPDGTQSLKQTRLFFLL